ncbi:PREDICTED: coiled-coil domain-containing protein 142 [Dufourea novaeangliae]|uniref:coiled-coil domain-containing protein 142 n=1 Tax=Dufourea novaeangliae TaxID=178035 RepID=UPI0007670A5E|nr:PREDICTED: coiled-coil domain-containing protein 142 [Dufourea novaeangliae]
MDSNYRANISKWLPVAGSVLEKWFAESSSLDARMGNLVECIALIIQDITDVQACDLEACGNIASDLGEVTKRYKPISTMTLSSHPIYKYKMRHYLVSMKRKLNVLARSTRNLINEIVDCKSEELLRVVFKLVNVYNDILSMDIDVSDPSTNVFHNDSPQMLEPLKKMSVTRILQMLAKNRAEETCHELIDCLLTNYEPRERTDPASTTEAGDVSENSSIEIYRALTRHLTPPIESASSKAEMEMSNVESIQTLVNTQNEQVLKLLNVVQDVSPQLLGNEALKTVKGETRLRSSATKKVKNYYQEVAWGALSGILDHVILWWSPEPLATHHSHGAQHLKDWLSQFVQRNPVSPTARPALQNLCDALGYHATLTVWDQLFRIAYTSAFQCQSRPSSTEGTDTGQKFAEVFQLLVRLSNECEAGGEWVIGAPVIELPLTEQIVILHRLDHSVHTVRLWIVQEAKTIAHTWELEVFFLLVKGDILNCFEELSYRKLADHTNELSMDSVNVQVYVCGKMRAKIASEVNVNVDLLQKCATECTAILAKICRVVSLANLHMCFPRSSYWRRGGNIAPTNPSLYVEEYFEKVLLPVLEVIEDHETSNMILRIMCEAWLDYIYLHRIKFSEHGALQLLTDFAYVSKWVSGCTIISQEVRDRLLKNEVLRRCEGVGRLLLRHPGEAISMRKKMVTRTNEQGSPESPGLERMPAEMYVPNQEQWLELRAPKRLTFWCTD